MTAQNSNSTLLLPSTTQVISVADSQDRAAFTAMSSMKEEPMDVDAGFDATASFDVNLSHFLFGFVIVIHCISDKANPLTCHHHNSF